MSISEMSEQEKSIMLARLCGWEYKHDQITGDWYIGKELVYEEWRGAWPQNDHVAPLNLYDPTNMALAWRVLNWAYLQNDVIEDSKYGLLPFGHVIASHFCDTCGARMMYPREAQRLWLDKILELALDAGMGEEE